MIDEPDEEPEPLLFRDEHTPVSGHYEHEERGEIQLSGEFVFRDRNVWLVEQKGGPSLASSHDGNLLWNYRGGDKGVGPPMTAPMAREPWGLVFPQWSMINGGPWDDWRAVEFHEVDEHTRRIELLSVGDGRSSATILVDLPSGVITRFTEQDSEWRVRVYDETPPLLQRRFTRGLARIARNPWQGRPSLTEDDDLDELE